MPTVGIVIPAYNEGENLHRVLEVVRATPWPAQIVVVDDGSADATTAVAERFAAQDPRIHALRLPQNRGKAGAMLAGVQALTTDLVTFLDADLIDLRSDCISDLCAPVLADQCEMAVALFQHGGLRTDGAHKLTPILSGQRCLHRSDALAVLGGQADSGYGVETAISLHAKRAGWRIQYVIWRHVSHVMKEQKRGWLAGLHCRWQMYAQISSVLLLALGMLWGVRTFITGLGAVKQLSRGHPRLSRAFSAAMAVLMLFSWFFQPARLRAYTDLRLQELSTWQPGVYQRVLVIAPHPDDEMLATGGYIASALAAQNPPEIRVVVVTDGDASYSTILFSGQNPISHMAYRQLAAVRREESREALQSLGLPSSQLSFLGFPDRGMSAIWQTYWDDSRPYRSPTTGLSASTQPDGSQVAYTGEEFLREVRHLLEDFQPDAVIIPHPRDAHADHQAVAHFFSLAIALNAAEDKSPTPAMFAYLMWLRGNPTPQGIRLDQESIRLPNKFVSDTSQWLRFPLAEEISQRKASSADFYRSQKRQLGAMLARNAGGGNELFAEVVLHEVPHLSAPENAPEPNDWLPLPYEKVWRGISLSLPGDDPLGLWSAVDDDSLHLAVEVGRWSSAHKDRFGFVVRTVGKDGSTELRVAADRFVQNDSGRFWVTTLPLSDLYASGDGRVALVTLETVKTNRVVGHSAWQLLYLSGEMSH